MQDYNKFYRTLQKSTIAGLEIVTKTVAIVAIGDSIAPLPAWQLLLISPRPRFGHLNTLLKQLLVTSKN